MTKEEIYRKNLTEWLRPQFPTKRLEKAVTMYLTIDEEREVIYKSMDEYAKEKAWHSRLATLGELFSLADIEISKERLLFEKYWRKHGNNNYNGFITQKP